MVTVVGEIEHQDAFLADAYRVLKPGGVISITEHHPDPDFESFDTVRRQLADHGFTVPEKRVGWRWAYTINGLR